MREETNPHRIRGWGVDNYYCDRTRRSHSPLERLSLVDPTLLSNGTLPREATSGQIERAR